MRYAFLQFLFTCNMIISATYMIATYSYRNSGSVLSNDVDLETDSYMWCTCLLNMLSWVIGTTYIGVGGTHFLHVLYLGSVLGFVVPGLCIYGRMLEPTEINGRDLGSQVKVLVMDYWRENRAPLPVLKKLQLHSKCCGLEGPTDYRAFIYPRNGSGGVACENEEFDVPYSCAKLETLYDSCFSKKNTSACNVYNFTREALSFDGDATDFDQMSPDEKIKYKCENGHNATVKLPEIQTDGCMELIQSNIKELRDSHNVMFFVFTAISLITFVIFIDYWFDMRADEDETQETIEKKVKSESKPDLSENDQSSKKHSSNVKSVSTQKQNNMELNQFRPRVSPTPPPHLPINNRH